MAQTAVTERAARSRRRRQRRRAASADRAAEKEQEDEEEEEQSPQAQAVARSEANVAQVAQVTAKVEAAVLQIAEGEPPAPTAVRPGSVTLVGRQTSSAPEPTGLDGASPGARTRRRAEDLAWWWGGAEEDDDSTDREDCVLPAAVWARPAQDPGSDLSAPSEPRWLSVEPELQPELSSLQASR